MVEISLEKNDKCNKFLNFGRPKWNFYLTSLETNQRYGYALIYLIVVLPMSVLSASAEKYLMAVLVHLIWGAALYFLVLRNGFIRGRCLKEISKIAVNDCWITEFDFENKVIRRVNCKNEKVVIRKRGSRYFDIEVRNPVSFKGIGRMKPFMPLDYGNDPSIYIACKVSIEEEEFVTSTFLGKNLNNKKI